MQTQSEKYDFFKEKPKVIKEQPVPFYKNNKLHFIMKFIAFCVSAVFIGMFFIDYTHSYISSQQQQTVTNNLTEIANTKALWGDLYEGVNSSLKKYGINNIVIRKTESAYIIDTVFVDGTTLYSKYPFTQDKTDKGLSGTYEYSLEVLQQYNKENQDAMVSRDFSTIIAYFHVDKSMAETTLIPELHYIIGRAVQTYIWTKLDEYNAATFSESNKNLFLSKLKPLVEDQGSNLFNLLLRQVGEKDGFYNTNKPAAIRMINMLSDFKINFDIENTCRIYEKYIASNTPDNDDKIFFNKIFNGELPNNVCDITKR